MTRTLIASCLPGHAPVGEEETFYRRLLDNLTDGVYFVNTDRLITYWNRGAETITGYTASEVIGRPCRDNLLIHTDDAGCRLCLEGCPMLAAMGDGARRQANLFLKHRLGHRVPVSVQVAPVRDRAGRIIGAVETFSDRTSSLVALQKALEMEELAMLDPLTGVGNRRYTEKTLYERQELFRRDCEPFAVLFLDIDHFKAVNDTFGHHAGDRILQVVALTVRNNLRPYDFLGRWGGEEFVAVLVGADAAGAATVAARCCALVRTCSVPFDGQEINPRISVGVALIQSGESYQEVVARADCFLYQAKSSGRDRFCGP